MKHITAVCLRIWAARRFLARGALGLALVIAGTASSAQTLTDGLQLYYPFAAAGDGALDASGNGHNGELHGTTWADAGHPAGSRHLGSGGYIDAGSAVNFASWEQYTISTWFRHDTSIGDTTGYGDKIFCKSAMYSDQYLRMVPESAGYVDYGGLHFQAATGGGPYPWAGYSLLCTDDFRDGAWHHVAIVRNGAHAGMWVDGVVRSTTETAVTISSNTQPIYLGYSPSLDSYQRRYWPGDIDEVRIYNRALSASEVQQLAEVGAAVTLDIASAYGSPDPTVGTHTQAGGSTVLATVDAVVAEGAATRHVCSGWSGSGSVPVSGTSNTVTVVVLEPSSLTWNWQTEHLLDTDAGVGGSVSGGGWYAAGREVTLTATADEHYQFVAWSDGEPTASRTVVVPEGGVSYHAVFAPIPRGTLRLQQTVCSVSEDAGIAQLKVERVDGNYGTATVAFEVSAGSATHGDDYSAEPFTLSWGNGQTGTRTIYVELRDDSAYEGNETFTVQLVAATGASLGEPAQALVTIVDDEGEPSRIPRIVGSLAFGDVPTNSAAVRSIEVWNDGNQPLSVTNTVVPAGFTVSQPAFTVPSGEAVSLSVAFAPAALVGYEGSLTLGCNATSGTLAIPVSGTGVVPVPSVAIRTITGTTAVIAVDVPEGSDLLGVEDVLSQGLIPLAISDGGTWDAVNRKVKWFFNQPGQVRDRALQYSVSGTGNVVTGLVNFGSGDLQITGDTVFTTGGAPGLLHPADDNGDWRIVLAEVSASVNRWKNGLDDQKTPTVIRGITLYLQGEIYAYDPEVGAEAKRWVPMLAPTSLEMGGFTSLAGSRSEPRAVAVRSVEGTNVTLTVTPEAGTSAWGVEESVPEGVHVSNIGNAGSWDASHRKIKWAFFDGDARTLSYSVSGDPGTNGIVVGAVSCDGSETAVTGTTVVAIPLPFGTWADRHGLAGESEADFRAMNAEYGQPNGLVYSFQSNLRPGEPLLDIGWADGVPVIETPAQDPSTMAFVDIAVEGTTDLGASAWPLGLSLAPDQTDVPANRRRWVPTSVPDRSFYRLKATPK